MLSVATDLNAEVFAGAHKVSAAQAAGTIDTGWVAKADFESAVAVGMLGAAAGTPTSQSLLLKFQDATDSSGTGAADYKPDGATVAASTTGITGLRAATDNTRTQLGANLKNARAYIRARGTLAFVAGSSPTNDVAIALILGGGQNPPTSAPNP